MAGRIPILPLATDRHSQGVPSSSYRSSRRPPSHSPHASRNYPSGANPMSIPNSSSRGSPPPPLPPPTFISQLAEGNDQGWRWANQGLRVEPSSRPVSPGTSAWDRRGSHGHRPSISELSEPRQREGSTSTVTSAAKSPTGVEFDVAFRDEGYISPPSMGYSQSVPSDQPHNPLPSTMKALKDWELCRVRKHGLRAFPSLKLC